LLLTIDSCSKGREEECRHREKQPSGDGHRGRNIEVNDDELGFVASEELNPQKSPILLMLKPRTTAEIQALFQSY